MFTSTLLKKCVYTVVSWFLKIKHYLVPYVGEITCQHIPHTPLFTFTHILKSWSDSGSSSNRTIFQKLMLWMKLGYNNGELGMNRYGMQILRERNSVLACCWPSFLFRSSRRLKSHWPQMILICRAPWPCGTWAVEDELLPVGFVVWSPVLNA